MSLEDGYPEGVLAAQLLLLAHGMMLVDSLSLAGRCSLCWSLFQRYHLGISFC